VRTRIKFCGCTSGADVELCVALGVDAIGVIFAPESPRCVSLATAEQIADAVPAFVERVAVFVDPTSAQVQQVQALGFLPQFSGDESAAMCEQDAVGAYIKVFHVAADATRGIDPVDFASTVEPYRRATPMLDTSVAGKHGGTGRAFDWELARSLAGSRRIIVSGGLTSANVGECIARLRPYAVDVRSGIETDGVKDHAKMRDFVRAVKEADAQA
jgi:phosphoribosylanthranilate isomerase